MISSRICLISVERRMGKIGFLIVDLDFMDGGAGR